MSNKQHEAKIKETDSKFFAIAKAILQLDKEFVSTPEIQQVVTWDAELNAMQIGQVLATRYRSMPNVVTRFRLDKTNAIGGSYLYGIKREAYESYVNNYNLKKVG